MAYCPFSEKQPYAETGPIFIHAGSSVRYPGTSQAPDMFLRRDLYLLKGYNKDNCIVFGTGEIVKSSDMDAKAASILNRCGLCAFE